MVAVGSVVVAAAAPVAVAGIHLGVGLGVAVAAVLGAGTAAVGAVVGAVDTAALVDSLVAAPAWPCHTGMSPFGCS